MFSSLLFSRVSLCLCLSGSPVVIVVVRCCIWLRSILCCVSPCCVGLFVRVVASALHTMRCHWAACRCSAVAARCSEHRPPPAYRHIRTSMTTCHFCVVALLAETVCAATWRDRLVCSAKVLPQFSQLLPQLGVAGVATVTCEVEHLSEGWLFRPSGPNAMGSTDLVRIVMLLPPESHRTLPRKLQITSEFGDFTSIGVCRDSMASAMDAGRLWGTAPMA